MNGHASLSNGFTPEECLDGLHFQIADWHAGNKFLQVNTCTCIMFSIMTRFGNLISTETMLHLYKAFILPHFCYCSMVWHFSSKQDSDKLDLLNQHIQFIFKDFNSEYIYLKGQQLQILRIGACKT